MIRHICTMLFFISICLYMTPGQSSAADTGYFSQSYGQARDKFLGTAKEAGARTAHFEHPRKGPDGEGIFTDVAVFGATSASNIIVLQSGTHGVEGFAGSGIQTALLKEGIQNDLPPETALVMIHAINPYGFAHLRRFNEDNIDINRNFIPPGDSFPGNPGYDELAEVIMPDTLSVWSGIKLWARLMAYRFRHGKAEMKRALSGGQYTHPNGLFFGGRDLSWSGKTLATIAEQYLCRAHRIIFIDFHTGLGPFGEAELIMNEPPASPAYLRARKIWGERVKTTVTGASVSAHLSGTLKLALPGLLPGVEVTAVSLEFGTHSPKAVFLALRTENWQHHNSEKTTATDRADGKKELLRVFYPATTQWNQSVLRQGRTMIRKAMDMFRH